MISKLKNRSAGEWVESVEFPGGYDSPGEDFDGVSDVEMYQEIGDELRKDSEVIAVSDSDVDGLSCIAILEKKFGVDNVSRVISGHSNYTVDFATAIDIVTDNGEGRPIYIMDILPGKGYKRALKMLALYDGEVKFMDHHEWSQREVRLASAVGDVDVRIEGDNCAAEIVYEHVDYKSDKMDDFVDVVRDHDAWLKEDSRSDDLADYQFHNSNEEYIEKVKEYGADITEDKSIEQELETIRYHKTARIEAQAKKARWYNINPNLYEDGYRRSQDGSDGGVKVAITYGTAYRSGVGEALNYGVEEEVLDDVKWDNPNFGFGDADITVITTPGEKVSFRSHENFDFMDKIATRFGNGGGHDCAASPDINFLSSTEDRAVHRASKGRVVDDIVLPDISSLVQRYKF